jgi:MSHA pilin protein MshB
MLNMLKNKQGFSLIELLVVMVIIAAITALAIPAYIGVKNRAHEASIIATARGNIELLNFWLQASTSSLSTREVDTNFDGIINNSDKTNVELLNDGVAVTFATNRNTIFNEKSPWSDNIPLWSYDASVPKGQITLLQESSFRIVVTAKNNQGQVIFVQPIN